MESTYVNAAGRLKPIKSGPKQYKTGAGPTGMGRLQRRISSLLVASVRLQKTGKTPEEIHWAERLTDTLLSFNAEMRDALPERVVDVTIELQGQTTRVTNE